MTEYSYHVAIVVTDNKRQAAGGRIADWSGDPEGASPLSVPLSTDGSEPATHWGCQVPVKTSVVESGALAALTNSTGAQTVIVRSGVGTPDETDHGNFWAWAGGIGLQRVWSDDQAAP